MTTITSDVVVAALIDYLQSKTSLTTLLYNNGADEIRERHWMGDIFAYPAVRISMDLFPSLPPCSPEKCLVYVCVYSEQKSSAECQNIAGVIKTILHEHPFSQGGIKFSVVKVTKVARPERSIFAWQSDVDTVVMVN